MLGLGLRRDSFFDEKATGTSWAVVAAPGKGEVTHRVHIRKAQGNRQKLWFWVLDS